jgi:predicted RNA-binding Zn-ribbon protein involved in translation (DUF1610 family)
MKARFFCGNCGAEVGPKAERCPSCRKYFTHVKCPQCGFEGNAESFIRGCPSCGFLIRRDAAVPEVEAPNARQEPSFHLPRSFYRIAAVILVAIVILLVVILLRLSR